jgi:hypothetical protein
VIQQNDLTTSDETRPKLICKVDFVT